MDGRQGELIIPVNYAAYGSNLHPLRVLERVPSARLLGTGFLETHSLTFHKRSVDGSGKCTILPGSDGVWIAVYAMSEADKRVMDAIEGVGEGYEDVRIDVPGFGPCRTYLAEPAFLDSRQKPYDWYRDIVLAGCRYHGFPDAYANAIGATPAIADPDGERSRENRLLLDRMAESPS